MADCMTQEDAMNMSIEQAIEILVPMRDMMLDQNGCPISDAYFALDKVIKYAERRGKWIERNPLESEVCRLIGCSECGKSYIVPFNVPYKDWAEAHKYCVECGARMEE